MRRTRAAKGVCYSLPKALMRTTILLRVLFFAFSLDYDAQLGAAARKTAELGWDVHRALQQAIIATESLGIRHSLPTVRELYLGPNYQLCTWGGAENTCRGQSKRFRNTCSSPCMRKEVLRTNEWCVTSHISARRCLSTPNDE